MDTTKNDYRAGVWMDHHHAYIISKNADGDLEVRTTISCAEKHPENEKPHNEACEHAREAHDLHKFFRLIQDHLEPYNHVLISGPTTAPAEFLHHLQKVRSFAGKRIAIEKAAKMTQPQLIAFMKEKLGKPMDIFRPEELV